MCVCVCLFVCGGLWVWLYIAVKLCEGRSDEWTFEKTNTKSFSAMKERLIIKYRAKANKLGAKRKKEKIDNE